MKKMISCMLAIVLTVTTFSIGLVSSAETVIAPGESINALANYPETPIEFQLIAGEVVDGKVDVGLYINTPDDYNIGATDICIKFDHTKISVNEVKTNADIIVEHLGAGKSDPVFMWNFDASKIGNGCIKGGIVCNDGVMYDGLWATITFNASYLIDGGNANVYFDVAEMSAVSNKHDNYTNIKFKNTVVLVSMSDDYVVTYNANGGKGAPTDQIKYRGADLVLSSTIPTRFGYSFLGWSSDPMATTATYLSGGNYTFDADVVLYAVWQNDIIDLMLNSTNDAVVSTEGEIKYFLFTPDLRGEYVIYSTGTADTKVSVHDINGNLLDENDNGGDGNNFRLVQKVTAGNKYVFAVGYVESSKVGTIQVKFGEFYTIKYNVNGGSDGLPSQIKDYGTDITLSDTIPILPGTTFLGWATSPTATEATYQPGDTFDINADTTLYAVWENKDICAMGNVDGYDAITTSDALMALQAAVQKIVLNPKQIGVADVDGIEGITASDALLILQRSVGKINKFPVEN